MALTAVTGTNGKTTCAHLYAELVDRLNKGSAASIGTLGYGMAGGASGADIPALGETGLTTPDAVAMQRILAELKSKGASTVALEVSSHSLVQRRSCWAAGRYRGIYQPEPRPS